MILGAHVSTAKGIWNAPLNARTLRVPAFQIFTKNQNRWTEKPLEPQAIDRYLRNCEECGITHTVSHDSYLINLCAVGADNLVKSRDAMLDEMERAEQLNIDYLVMHPGSHLGAGIEAGIKAIGESFRLIMDKTETKRVRVLIETTAGQGTNLGYTFEQVAEMLRLTDCPERMGVCLDTCHIFAAGYDYSTQEGYEAVIANFDSTIGLANLRAFHVNDSKKAFGSKVDRHEHIGEGFITADPLLFWLRDPRFESIPGLLETPGEIEDYARNLELLRSLI